MVTSQAESGLAALAGTPTVYSGIARLTPLLFGIVQCCEIGLHLKEYVLKIVYLQSSTLERLHPPGCSISWRPRRNRPKSNHHPEALSTATDP